MWEKGVLTECKMPTRKKIKNPRKRAVYSGRVNQGVERARAASNNQSSQQPEYFKLTLICFGIGVGDSHLCKPAIKITQLGKGESCALVQMY